MLTHLPDATVADFSATALCLLLWIVQVLEKQRQLSKATVCKKTGNSQTAESYGGQKISSRQLISLSKEKPYAAMAYD